MSSQSTKDYHGLTGTRLCAPGTLGGPWATEAGGATVTLGIHLTDLCLGLMGDWQEV